MVAGSLPASFASAKRSNVSHVSHRNESVAQAVRLVALETEAARLRERVSSKYAGITPRALLPPPGAAGPTKYKTLTAVGAPATTLSTDRQQAVVPADDEDVTEHLIMPQQQNTQQLICPNGESRIVDQHEEVTTLSTWDRLNIPRRVLEAHDVFVTTAGRVRPYATMAPSPRRPQPQPGIPDATGTALLSSSGSSRSNKGDTEGVALRGHLRLGLSRLKDSSSNEVKAVDLPNVMHRYTSPRKSQQSLLRSPLRSSPSLPEIARASDDALAGGDM